MRGGLEPDVQRRFDAMADEPGTDEEAALYIASAAISLKRIADALSNEGSPRGDLLHWLETISMDIRAAGR